MDKNGVDVEKIVGLENIGSIWDKNYEKLDKEYKEKLEKASRILREDEVSADISNHLLAIGRN